MFAFHTLWLPKLCIHNTMYMHITSNSWRNNKVTDMLNNHNCTFVLFECYIISNHSNRFNYMHHTCFIHNSMLITHNMQFLVHTYSVWQCIFTYCLMLFSIIIFLFHLHIILFLNWIGFMFCAHALCQEWFIMMAASSVWVWQFLNY